MKALPIEANDFELKHALLTMVGQHTFFGYPSEDPNYQLDTFIRFANIMKMNGITNENFKVRLFALSLSGMVMEWLKMEPIGSIRSWNSLVEKNLTMFHPHRFIAPRRKELLGFKQGENESLYSAWKRLKIILKKCYSHGIDGLVQMEILPYSELPFYGDS